MLKQFAAVVTVSAMGATSAVAKDSPSLLSAFFGLDDSRQIRARTALVCQGIAGGDGMPVIFSHEVDPDTLDPEDFRVTRASGETG